MTPREPGDTGVTDRCWQALRGELDQLADALVVAGPGDLPGLRDRVRRAAETHRRCAARRDDIARLLEHMSADLAFPRSLDAVYYARQLVVAADRLPN